MNTAVMTASDAVRRRTESASALDTRHQALFWRSPFAVCAAVLVSTQLSLLALSTTGGESFPYALTLPLTALSATVLSAGIWPSWNYFEVTKDGLDQQAGLRSLVVRWADVQNVRVLDGWVELRVVTGDAPGQKTVRTKRVFNRYDLPAEAFGELIENAWMRGRNG